MKLEQGRFGTVMRAWRIVILGLAAQLALPNAGASGQLASAGPAEQEALGAVMQELDAAWNARDAARLSAVFAEAGSFQFPIEGVALRGRDEIRRHFAGQFATLPPGLRHVTAAEGSDVIVPGVIAVDCSVEIVGEDPKTGRAETVLARYRGVGLGVRTEAGWRIRLVRLYSVT